MKVHLVDGTYELFRHYFAVPKTSVNGREIGATRGVVRSIVSMLEGGFTHIGVATDHVIESFRNDMFAGYKTGAGIEPELRQQFELLERAITAIGVTVWPMIEFEADDALASAAAIAETDDRVEQVLIATPDKDLAQCVVGSRVVQLDRRTDTIRDEAGVHERFGVAPASIPDYLALVGDSADGIPGIPGWGAKGSAAVLSEYGHLENIPAAAADWSVSVRGATRLADALNEHRDDARLYRSLAVLRRDAPTISRVDELRWEGPTGDLDAVCVEIAASDVPRRLAATRPPERAA